MTEQEEFEFRDRMEREQAASSSVDITPQPKNNATLTTGAVLGGGALAYGAGRFINEPNRLIKPIDSQLQGIAKSQIGKEVSTPDLPALLTSKYNDFKANTLKPSLDAVNQNHRIQSTTIRNNRNLFDQKVMNPTIDDVSKHIADNYKTFTDSGYKSYRNAQNNIESIIEKSGQSLQSEDIANNLFSKTLNDAIQKGVPETQLSKLKQLSAAFEKEGNLVDLLGNKMNTSEPIPFSQIKGNVGYLLNELPDGARHILADNWNSYMGKYVPLEAKGIYDAMQQQYSKFAPARNALFDLIDRDNGKFDTKKLSNRLRMFVKNNQDSGVTDLLGVLKDGTDITKPIQGLAPKVDALSQLNAHRNDYATQLINLEKSKQGAIQGAQQVQDMLDKGRQDYTGVYRKTQELLSQKDAIMEKYPIRTILSKPTTILKGLGKAASIGGKLAIGLPFGVIAGKMQEAGGGYDPAEAFHMWMTMHNGTPKEKSDLENKMQKAYSEAMGI